LEVLQKTAPTIYEKPIIFEIDKRFEDFGTHHEGITVPAGFVVPGSASFVERDDGRTSLSVIAKIWKKYSGRFLEIFKQDRTDKKGVSVEMELYKYEDLPNGLKNLLDWSYSAICVLGDFITEASPGAEITIVSFASKEKEEYEKLRQLEFGRYESEIDFTIPEKIITNAKRGLELNKKFNRGGNSVSKSHAKHLVANKSTDHTRVKTAHRYMLKNGSNDIDDANPTSNQITFLLWGGQEAISWIGDLHSKIDAIDNRHISYYSELSGSNKPEKEEILVTDEEKQKLEQEQKEKDAQMALEEEEKKKKFSLDPYLDVSAVLSFLEKEKETYQEVSDDGDGDVDFGFKNKEEKFDFSAELNKPEEEKNMALMAVAAYAQYCKMSKFCKGMATQMSELKAKHEEMCNKFAQEEEKNKAYMAENEELKAKEKERQQKEFQFAVDVTLKEIENKVEIPEEEINVLREKSKEFSVDQIDAWKNLARSRALDFAMKTKKEDEGYVKIPLPWNGDPNRKVNGSPWHRD
jgi:hypothetical protein